MALAAKDLWRSLEGTERCKVGGVRCVPTEAGPIDAGKLREICRLRPAARVEVVPRGLRLQWATGALTLWTQEGYVQPVPFRSPVRAAIDPGHRIQALRAPVFQGGYQFGTDGYRIHALRDPGMSTKGAPDILQAVGPLAAYVPTDHCLDRPRSANGSFVLCAGRTLQATYALDALKFLRAPLGHVWQIGDHARDPILLTIAGETPTKADRWALIAPWVR